MLSNKKEKMKCAKCNQAMTLARLPKYEYEDGYPLKNVEAYKCTKCGKIFFTESQAKRMETRTSDIKHNFFFFERTLTISGKSLVVSIPSELVNYLRLKKGQKVKVQPIAKEGFIIRKAV